MEEQEPRLRVVAPSDAPWIRAVHLAHYAEVAGFGPEFADTVDAALAELLGPPGPDGAEDALGPPAVSGWIGEHTGERCASLLLSRDADGSWRLRLFMVLAPARGRGLGRRLLARAETVALEAGAPRIVVATHREHVEACALYASAGYRACA